MASCKILTHYKIPLRLCRQIVINLAAHFFLTSTEMYIRFALNVVLASFQHWTYLTVFTWQWCGTSRRFIFCSFCLFRFSYIFSSPHLFCQPSCICFKRSTVLLISWHNHCFKLYFPLTPLSCRDYYAYSKKEGQSQGRWWWKLAKTEHWDTVGIPKPAVW